MEDLAQVAIDSAITAGAEFADVRIENSRTAIIEITDGVTKRSTASRLRGAGIRAFINGAWAFAQTADLTPRGMRETAVSAARLAMATEPRVSEHFAIDGPTFRDRIRFRQHESFNDVSMEEKVSFVKMIDDQARTYDQRISNTRSLYGELWTDLYVANSLGTSVSMENSLPRILSSLTAKDGANRQRAFISLGVRGGYEMMRTEKAASIGVEAARLVVDLLSSKAAEGGVYDVIMDPILNGVMVHEAFGHACEADNWLLHTTVLEDKVGKSVGPTNLNISDNPTLEDKRGSFEYDWEGTRTRKRSLVSEGVLTDRLHSLETACRLGDEPNGAARAQSFQSVPIPRMSNTYMEPGDWNVDELIEDTKHGILLCSFNYGYTEPSKGQFMFQASHGYLIENGEKGQMVRDVSIAGDILEILGKVNAIANDFEMDAGTCGKSGQMVPDMSGGPHARIIGVPVGGM